MGDSKIVWSQSNYTLWLSQTLNYIVINQLLWELDMENLSCLGVIADAAKKNCKKNSENARFENGLVKK